MSATTHRMSPPPFLRSVLLLATMQLHALLKGKRVVFLFILLAVPLFIAVVLKTESSRPVEDFAAVAPQAFLVFLLPLIALFHGASAIGEEIDQRTLGYLVLRPLPRDRILLGKFLGAWTACFFLVSWSVVASHMIVFWKGSVESLLDPDLLTLLLRFLLITGLGCAVYIVFSMYLSVRIKRPVMGGLVYFVVVEFLFQMVPGPVANLAMTTHLQRQLPTYYETMEKVIAIEAGRSLTEGDPLTSTAIVLLVFGLMAVLTLLRFRAFDLTYGNEAS